MVQLRNHWVTARDMVRSRAWREGYESFRRGAPPDYGARGPKALAYEYGRLTAASMQGEGQRLRLVSARRPVNAHDLPALAQALKRAAVGRFDLR